MFAIPIPIDIGSKLGIPVKVARGPSFARGFIVLIPNKALAALAVNFIPIFAISVPEILSSPIGVFPKLIAGASGVSVANPATVCASDGGCVLDTISAVVGTASPPGGFGPAKAALVATACAEGVGVDTEGGPLTETPPPPPLPVTPLGGPPTGTSFGVIV